MSNEADAERTKRANARRADPAHIGDVFVVGQESGVQTGAEPVERFIQLRLLSERLWRFSGRNVEGLPRDRYPGEVFEIRRG